MVQQSQYHYSLPVEQAGSPATQPRGKGRKPSRAGRKRLRQGLGQNPRRHRSQRPAAAQQPWGPGTLSPVSTRGKAEPTTRHPAAQWGLEPSPSTAMTMLEQDLAGGKRAPGGAQQGAGSSAHPACTARPEGGSIGSSLAGEVCGTAPMPAPAVEGRREQGPGRVCRCYKRLDKCEHQILPHEVKYELHNMDTRTLFHCNCTRRLMRSLRRARDLSDMQVPVLADGLAMDCFVLESHTDCSLGEGPQHNCTTATRAVLVPAQQLKKTLKRWGPPHVTSKAVHPDWKTQDSGATLYERCLQLALEQKPGTRHHVVPR